MPSLICAAAGLVSVFLVINEIHTLATLRAQLKQRVACRLINLPELNYCAIHASLVSAV